MNIRKKKWFRAQKRKEAEAVVASDIEEVTPPVEEVPKATKKRRKRSIPKTPSTRPRRKATRK